MESPTAHYSKLQDALNQLKILIQNVDPIECKTNLQDLKLQSYILLSHAIFEEYLERLVGEIASEARKALKKQNHISKVLLGLVASGIIDEVEEKKANRKIVEKTFRSIADFSDTAYNNFLKLIDDNHGVKKENQKKLLLPIGIDPEQIDFATMAALDAFGTVRGGIAHKFKIGREHSLSQIQNEINQITLGLINFDEAACEALKTGMSSALTSTIT